MQPGATNPSLFSRSSKRPSRPRRRGCCRRRSPGSRASATSFTSGCSGASQAAVPSEEAWSTTIVSMVARRSASAARPRDSAPAAPGPRSTRPDGDVGHSPSLIGPASVARARQNSGRRPRRSGRRRRSRGTASSGRRRWRSASPPGPQSARRRGAPGRPPRRRRDARALARRADTARAQEQPDQEQPRTPPCRSAPSRRSGRRRTSAAPESVRPVSNS